MSGSVWPDTLSLIESVATAVIGAGPWERSEDRVAVSNGTRRRILTTTAGDLELLTS
jgi:transposase-like protein